MCLAYRLHYGHIHIVYIHVEQISDKFEAKPPIAQQASDSSGLRRIFMPSTVTVTGRLGLRSSGKPYRGSRKSNIHCIPNIGMLRRIFDAFEGNGDGQISVSELGQGLQGLGFSILNCIPNVGRLRRIFDAFDGNGDR
ncbi:hypothetical protein SUGI_0651500 [Cryptomeria japonica]|nr:hypothetical protein SUGI_0651500 [Cryptomeria japonica]